MTQRFQRPIFAASLAAALALTVRADAPRTYAITGARIVTVAGPTIETGTIVLRDGLIDAVGANLPAPPDAWVVDGKGLTVYPGLIDMGTTVAVDVPRATPPQSAATTEELERWKRGVIFRPHFLAADHIKTDSTDLAKFASAGITSVLAIPEGTVMPGQSALVNVKPPADEPQIGSMADVRSGLLVVKTPVALHVEFSERSPGAAYPESLMGVIAFLRQSFLDAQHYRLEQQAYARRATGLARPTFDPAYEALGSVLDGRIPVAFVAGENREIRRALRMAAEFKLDPIITGGLEADQVGAEIKAAKARVIFSLDYPTRPKTLAPDADEPLRVLRQRANTPKVPAALQKVGLTFAFQSAGLKEPKDFVKNAARAVKEGLPADAAIRALTIDAARIAGAGDRLGSLEKGKIANIVVADGDLFADATKITHVFVDGRMIRLDDASGAAQGLRPGRLGF